MATKTKTKVQNKKKATNSKHVKNRIPKKTIGKKAVGKRNIDINTAKKSGVNGNKLEAVVLPYHKTKTEKSSLYEFRIAEESWKSFQEILEAGAKALHKTGFKAMQIKPSYKQEYYKVSTLPCNVKDCLTPITSIKNLWINGKNLGFYSFCEDHKKESQKEDIDKNLDFTER